MQKEDKHTENKHSMRLHFSRQLERKFAHMPTLIQWSRGTGDAKLVNGRVVWDREEHKHQCCFCAVQTCGYKAIALVASHNGLACHLDIEVLRRQSPGGVLESGGDIDNRLKGLLDSLALPLRENQVPGNQWGKNDERLNCLLEDDALVSRLTIKVERWDQEPETPDKADHVQLRVAAHIEPYEPRMYHAGF